MTVVTSCKNTPCKDQDTWQEIHVRVQIPHFPEGYDYQILSSHSGVARGGAQGFWNPSLGYETGCNFKQRRKKNQKGIACYIKGYSIVIIKKISKRSAGQHCSAYAKHSARLKVMKCMIFFFFALSINTCLIALEGMSSERLFANQFEEIIWNCMDMNCIWTLTSIARQTAHHMWY